ncbi:hypothetical protein DSECCO2_616250 [anaerobic digester metagenome]
MRAKFLKAPSREYLLFDPYAAINIPKILIADTASMKSMLISISVTARGYKFPSIKTAPTGIATSIRKREVSMKTGALS